MSIDGSSDHKLGKEPIKSVSYGTCVHTLVCTNPINNKVLISPLSEANGY